MAYIKKRNTKKGISFLIQNRIVDPITGKVFISQ